MFGWLVSGGWFVLIQYLPLMVKPELHGCFLKKGVWLECVVDLRKEPSEAWKGSTINRSINQIPVIPARAKGDPDSKLLGPEHVRCEGG